MLGIAIRFLAGRYHSTPWGRHVNEAAPEWPPSPWRLLRSLVATWKLKTPNLPQATVLAVLRKLAEPPRFVLPPAALGHSRHYMPWFKKGPQDRTLVFDGFVAVSPQTPVLWLWPEAELLEAERAALASLLEKLAYLGRAESWCSAQLLSPQEAAAAQPNAWPLEGEQLPGPGQELVRVLCADPETAFSSDAVAPQPEPRKGRGKGKRSASARSYDPAWNLCIETSHLQEEGWSDPPGSRWVDYVRPADCFRPALAPRRPATRRSPIQVARYVLDGTVLPLVTETLPLAEQARARLMGIHGRLAGGNGQPGRSETFSGKNEAGEPLEGHGHAYYLLTDEDGDGRLDHLTVVAERGFDELEVRALDRLRELTINEGAGTIQLLLMALGKLEDFAFPPLAQDSWWVSATPFIVTRHPKKNGRKRDPVELLADRAAFTEQVLREELDRFCERRGLPWNSQQVHIERIQDPPGVFVIQPQLWAPQAVGPRLRPLQFKRFRSRKPDDDGGRRPSGTFRIRFPEPVRGPVCLGHSAHFGMGLFLPCCKDVDK